MIRLAKPYIPKEAYGDIKKILESGNLIQGQYVACFEEDLANYLDIPFVKLVSSGTAALHLSLMALDIRPGDEVIVPAFTYPATANVVEIIGAKPVLIDINLSDFCINTSLIEERITPETKAIIPVHEFGQPADMEPILKLAKKYNLNIIEDAACALGSEYHNQKIGTIGDIGCFSLHPRKAITTGEGGIVVTRNANLAEKIALLRNHGAKKVDRKLDFLIAGLNYRITEFQAALGISQLKIIEQLVNKRVEQAQIYSDFFAEINEIVIPVKFKDRKHIYQTFHVLLKTKTRDSIINKMLQKGIETNLGAQALHCLDYYINKYGHKPNQYPNAEIAFYHGLALPIGMHLDNDKINFIGEELLKLIR